MTDHDRGDRSELARVAEESPACSETEAELDKVGEWSEVKLEILRQYAPRYSSILKAKKFPHIYIDAFAGWGEHISRRTRQVIDGSPLNALAAKPPFDEYHFIDLEQTRADHLRRRTRGRSDVHIHAGDSNDILLTRVFPRAKYEDYRRALCLLDPYNIDVSWQVVATAGEMRSIEIFLNFMVMDMNMNVLLNNPAKANAGQVARMNRFWGSESWRDAVYEESAQPDLWGQTETVKVEGANERIAEAYRRRLIEVAGFKYAPVLCLS